MALMEWNDSLSVKVTEIDKQHQNLLNLINNLNDAMKEGKSKEVLKDIIEGLLEYSANHFTAEEKYFDQFHYPKGTAHKKEHTKFVTDIMEFKKGFDDGKLTLSLDVMNFLKDWLSNHIKGSDKQYTQCFNENGLH